MRYTSQKQCNSTKLTRFFDQLGLCWSCLLEVLHVGVPLKLYLIELEAILPKLFVFKDTLLKSTLCTTWHSLSFLLCDQMVIFTIKLPQKSCRGIATITSIRIYVRMYAKLDRVRNAVLRLLVLQTTSQNLFKNRCGSRKSLFCFAGVTASS